MQKLKAISLPDRHFHLSPGPFKQLCYCEQHIDLGGAVNAGRQNVLAVGAECNGRNR